MSRIFSTMLLPIVFFLVLTPIALVLRAFGYDPLKLRSNQSVSQWLQRKAVSFDARFFHKQG